MGSSAHLDSPATFSKYSLSQNYLWNETDNSEGSRFINPATPNKLLCISMCRKGTKEAECGALT